MVAAIVACEAVMSSWEMSFMSSSIALDDPAETPEHFAPIDYHQIDRSLVAGNPSM
jgi:hypothetical protein